MRYLTAFFLLVSFTAFSQSTYAPLNEDYYHWVDRYEIKTGKILPQLFTGIKPYKRSAIVDLIDSAYSLGEVVSEADQFNYEYLRNDSWEWSNAETSTSAKPILKHFYKKKSDLFHVQEKSFDLHINPVLYVGAGKDSRRDDMLFINTRGVEVRGMIDRKVGFYTYLTDNQAVLPSYVWEPMAFNPVIPHEGFWKEYKNAKGVDFLQARGYITVEATRHINVQFGHDRMFIGNGYRSLVFSDYAPPVWFLKGNIKVWKINYLFQLNQTVAFANGTQGGLNASNSGYPNKFNALHHLSINIGKKLTLGVFESVIFHPDDSTNFRLDYLNPIIFYRAIEQQNGSSDNVLLGMDFKWNAVKKVSFYGQLLLDEFVIDNIKKGNGWWANKFGIQCGAKYVDAFGLANLDLQGEFNIVRPYTYSHNSKYGNYSGFLQPLAHPLGANFKELIGIVRYQPLPRLNVTGKLIFVDIGRDPDDENWGSNIFKENSTREKEYNNEIGQGVSNKIVYGSLTASWQFRHNLFIDGTAIIRKSESDLSFYNNNTSITSLALRWNIPQRQYEF